MSETWQTFPVLWPHDRDAIAQWKRLSVPRAVPWVLIAPHAAQAERNHGQTLERLAERGGLGVRELIAVLEGHAGPWVRSATDEYCAKRLQEMLAALLRPPVVPPPPDWAICQREGERPEYMLARYTDDPEVAEQMSVELAERHVVAFAERVQAWLSARGRVWPARTYELWREVANAQRKAQGLDDDDELVDVPSYESWCGERIVEHAKGKPLP